MARSPVAVDVQLAVGLGPSPISSLSWLPLGMGFWFQVFCRTGHLQKLLLLRSTGL
uniref:Uncharacterized protein n=1 Tax=Fagus sylvatica TaxID=28930 RepID=A0A2N9GMT4_FAGSY